MSKFAVNNPYRRAAKPKPQENLEWVRADHSVMNTDAENRQNIDVCVLRWSWNRQNFCDLIDICINFASSTFDSKPWNSKYLQTFNRIRLQTGE